MTAATATRRDATVTLYVDGRQAHTISVRHAALVVRSRRLAPRYVPLQRLYHVIIIGAVNLSAKAMAELCQRGISVGFMQRDGHMAGTCVPAQLRDQDLVECCLELIERTDFRVRLAMWAHHILRESLRRLCEQPGRNPRIEHPQHWLTEYDAQWLCHFAPAQQAEVQRLDAMMELLASQTLIHAGVPATDLANDYDPLHLVPMLARALRGWLRFLLVRDGRQQLRSLNTSADSVRWYHDHWSELARHAQAALYRLKREIHQARLEP